MPSFTVRNIPDGVHRAIRARAALHGRSTEPNEPKLPSARSSITRRFAGISGPGLCPVWYPVLLERRRIAGLRQL